MTGMTEYFQVRKCFKNSKTYILSRYYCDKLDVKDCPRVSLSLTQSELSAPSSFECSTIRPLPVMTAARVRGPYRRLQTQQIVKTYITALPSSLISHDGEDSGRVQIILQRLHGSSEFAPGNAVILLPVLVQYIPVIVTPSKLTGISLACLLSCEGENVKHFGNRLRPRPCLFAHFPSGGLVLRSGAHLRR